MANNPFGRLTNAEFCNENYCKLNHLFIEIRDIAVAYESAIDYDKEILEQIYASLAVLNGALDKMKSEMTVKTKFKDTDIPNKGPTVLKFPG